MYHSDRNFILRNARDNYINNLISQLLQLRDNYFVIHFAFPRPKESHIKAVLSEKIYHKKYHISPELDNLLNNIYMQSVNLLINMHMHLYF